MSDLDNILAFIKEIENLKNVTRTAWTSQGKQESVAEHSWRLAVLALSLAEYFPDIDLGRTLGMCLVHDFGEIYEGDISAKYENDPKGKLVREANAINHLTRMLSESQKRKIYNLWKEYNDAESEEARFVKALDKMETIVQHNQGENPLDFDYRFNLEYGAEYANYNPKLQELRALIDRDTEEKCLTDIKENSSKAINQEIDQNISKAKYAIKNVEKGIDIGIRELQLKDLNDYLYWNHPSREYHKFNGPYYGTDSEEEIRRKIDELRALMLSGEKNVLGNKKMIVDKKTDTIIGQVNWYWKSAETLWMEVGIVIYNEDYWGQGIGSKALKMWIDDVFQNNPDIIRLGLTTWSGNYRMMNLAEKLGLKKEAVYRKARIVDGSYYDSVSYGILRDEWQMPEYING